MFYFRGFGVLLIAWCTAEEGGDSALLFIGQLDPEYKQMGVFFPQSHLEKTSTWKRDLLGWEKGKEMIAVFKCLKGCYRNKKVSVILS